MNGKSIIPRGLANRDVEEAIDHYLDDAGERTALAFAEALEHPYEHIARDPRAGPPPDARELDLPVF